MNYEIIFENIDFLIINKFPDISFNNEESKTGLFDQLKNEFESIYPVHRLDKVTSGLVIIGKNEAAAKEFGFLFSNQKINKFYLAISDQKPKKKQGLIKGDMTKSRNGSWKLLKQFTNPAITQFLSFSIVPSKRIYILRPHTGKTHQLRVAMKSLGAPILGDKLYSGTRSDRTYLHAFYLKFVFLDVEYVFSCVPKIGEEFLNKDFEKKLIEIGDPLNLDWPHLK